MSMSANQSREGAIPWTELALVACLIGVDVIARLLPHAPGFTPVAATALFAGTILRFRALALLVPLAPMLAGDAVLGFYDWRVMSVVYVAAALPVLAGWLSRRWRAPLVFVPAILSCSLLFFVATNFAVWAFGGIYSHSLEGLMECYVAALPFLRNAAAGDLFWATLLFGGYHLARAIPLHHRLRRSWGNG
jgi:hypothetical protein